MSMTPSTSNPGILNTLTNVSRGAINLPILGTVSIGAVIVIFGITYILTRRKQKFAVVKI